MLYIWNYLVIENYDKNLALFDIKSALKLMILNLLQYSKKSFTHFCAKQTFRFVGINTDGVNKIYTRKIRDKFLLFILMLSNLLIDN